MITRKISNNLFFTNIKNIIDSGNSVELKIKGTSMHPTLLNGKHKVVLVPYQKQYLQIGTIALFAHNNKYILHRLVAINEDLLTFQGDNLPYTKEYITEKDIVALVKFIITPSGKIIDCRKRYFFFKSKLQRSILLSHSILSKKTKDIFLKTPIYHIKPILLKIFKQ
ncbi:MAG: S24/S26 family peptidase [Dysgonomonas sp.]|nr:S24/S26 family peptidase [Dysgonomonas sp.]